MKIKNLMAKALPEIPDDISDALTNNSITETPFDSKNSILFDSKLQNEVGFVKMEDDTFLVAMICPMPGITPEMIDWWFWWHPQEHWRYKVWFPGEHFGIGYSKKQKEYFNKKSCPPFQNNTHYPLEKIGKAVLPLRIDFVTPDEFGFSMTASENNNICRIVCGHVGVFNNLVRHTEMAHIFKQTEEGLLLISRFWLGQTMKSRFLRKLIINENMAKGMAEHCCVEYRNLCEILPKLYEEFR